METSAGVEASEASEESGELPSPAAVRKRPFVVGIGASAGGLEAIERFFRAMPAGTGMAFVLVQHLSPHFRSFMGELLARFSPMPVQLLDGDVRISSDTIYFAPPGKEVEFVGDVLHLADLPARPSSYQPISAFFRSLARAHGERSAAIVLSGAGTDGSLGVGDVRDAGGLVIVQDEQTAKFDSMPRSSAATGFADFALAPEQMPEALLEHLRSLDDGSRAVEQTEQNLLRGLFERLHDLFHVDFSGYKQNTIGRRIARRALALGYASSSVYIAKVLGDEGELATLFDELLIGVTEFFREPEAFEQLGTRVLPLLIAGLKGARPLRVWVPACSTGEEAYSLAISIHEAFALAGLEPQLKVFATDVNRSALQFASEGVYPRAALQGVSEELRARYFLDEPGGQVRVVPSLRKSIIFSVQNILADPPFTRADLVSCRNFLIYLEGFAQAQAIGALYFALRPGGVLFLGPSEALGDFAGDFEPVAAERRLFRKLTDRRTALGRPSSVPLPMLSARVPLRSSPPSGGPDHRVRQAYDELLNRFVPPGALLDEERRILHIFGAGTEFFQPMSGPVNLDVVSLVEPSLQPAVLSAMLIATRERKKVSCLGTRGSAGAEPSEGRADVEVIVEPLTSSGTPLYLLQFRKRPSPSDLEGSDTAAQALLLDHDMQSRIQVMESELQHTRISLQQTVEQLETANEELQSTNEELHAANEELQSTNEELHSVNEELYSVNDEHERKISELDQVAGYLRNLMRETEVGIIFTDQEGAVQLYTPAAAQMLNLMPQDLGRPLEHITSKIPGDDIFEVVQAARETQSTYEKRVALPSGRVVFRRIKPYRDVSRAVGGIMVSFVDVTDLVQAEDDLLRLNGELETRIEELKASQERLRLVTEYTTDGYIDIDLERDTVLTSASYRRFLGVDGETTRAELELRVHPDDRARIAEVQSRALVAGEPNFSLQFRVRDGLDQWRWVLSRTAVFAGHDGRATRLLTTVTDIRALKLAEEQLRDLTASLERKVAALAEREMLFRTMIESLPDGVLMVDGEGRLQLTNDRVSDIFGLSRGELANANLSDLLPEARRAWHERMVREFTSLNQHRVMAAGRVIEVERRDGRKVALEIGIAQVTLNGEPRALARLTDVTERVKTEADLRLSEVRFRRVFHNASLGEALLDPEGYIVEANDALCKMTGFDASELVGRTLTSLTHVDDRALAELAHETNASSVVRIEKRVMRKDGTAVWTRVGTVDLGQTSGEESLARKLAIFEDISELRRAEDLQRMTERKLQEAAKLESLGLLAGGIAHDFNNILTGVLSSAQLAKEEISRQQLDEVLDDIVIASRRAADICSQLLAYSGRSRFVLTDVDMSWLVRDTERLIHVSVNKAVKVDTSGLGVALPPVRVDRGQLQQVIMNLTLNASDAIGDRGGTIRFKTALAGPELLEPELRDTPWLLFEISDDGPGIEAPNLGRIFDPFFTTKATGRGLGLAAVQGIVKAHQGKLQVHSVVGEGTRFRLLLPCSGSAGIAVPESVSVQSQVRLARGTATILVVDDEEMIRRALQRQLESRGYVVVCAADGEEAVKLFRDAPRRFDAVLLDLTMPKLDGTRAFHQMREVSSSVRVVLMSGYSEVQATSQLAGMGLVGFLKKPIEKEELFRFVEEAVNGREELVQQA